MAGGSIHDDFDDYYNDDDDDLIMIMMVIIMTMGMMVELTQMTNERLSVHNNPF